MVDVGCGIGGSSRHISRKFGCTAQGITLSPVQACNCIPLNLHLCLNPAEHKDASCMYSEFYFQHPASDKFSPIIPQPYRAGHVHDTEFGTKN